jgi:hypothetical protein
LGCCATEEEVEEEEDEKEKQNFENCLWSRAVHSNVPSIRKV